MGRKSSSKHQPPTGASTEHKSGFNPLLLGVIIIAIVGIGAFAFWPSAEKSAQEAAAPADTPATAKSSAPTPEVIAQTEAIAALGPHKQANLPPIPFRGYAPPRSPEIVTAAFHFAAEHPEITGYAPCFCGCEQSGHRGNHDCFVKARAANGDVTEWEEHGVECAVCIDVATRSRQMYSSGASARDIRAAIEKEFAPKFMTMTPTPHPTPDAHDH